MARIRTIKPEFFRHEALQDLEIENPGMHVMLVFAGLWGHCDSKGRFEWRPRQLKLDILPFLSFDMAETLDLLKRARLVNHYVVDGKEYGEVPNFEKHQRITGKEASDGEKYPANTWETTGKQQGNTRDKPVAQEGEKEGKGKGREREREEDARASPGNTDKGDICKALKSAGITDINQSNPVFLKMIEAGASVDEFRQAAFKAAKSGKLSFNYVVATVKNQREDAARLVLHQGPLPTSPPPKSSVAQEREAVSYALTGRKPKDESTSSERVIDGEASRVA